MERIAIIDLGSNSIRFIIMQIGEHGAYKLIYQAHLSPSDRGSAAAGPQLSCRLLPYHRSAKDQKGTRCRDSSRQKCHQRGFFLEARPHVDRHPHDDHQWQG